MCITILKEVSICSLMYLFDQKYSEILLQFKINDLYWHLLKNDIYFCDSKLNFQQHYSSLQSHMILQKSF